MRAVRGPDETRCAAIRFGFADGLRSVALWMMTGN